MYFTIKELTHSDTAIKKKIDNTPSKEIINNMNELIAFLDPIREAWGKPIYINSGYRCPALNKAVGGVKNSSHLIGYAVDIKPQPGLKEFLVSYLKGKKFDQCIDEGNWIHFGLKRSDGAQRCQIFKA